MLLGDAGLGTEVETDGRTGSGHKPTRAIALAGRTQTYPLSEAANPKPTRVLDGWDKPWHSLPVYDATWFEKLAQFVKIGRAHV